MDNEALYDRNAASWSRREPLSLSDFTGRPAVFDLCGDVRGLSIVDLGCGEGYCARELMARGASQVHGVDSSAKMIELAEAQEAELGHGIRYTHGDVLSLACSASSFDLAVAVFLFNYLRLEELEHALRQIHRVLKPGGALVFAVPHPAFPFMRAPAPPFFFETEDRGYFSGRDSLNEGEIHCLDGTRLPIRLRHKTFEDYFTALSVAGFSALPELREQRVLDEHLARDRRFFEPVRDIPLHLSMRVRR